MFQCHSGDKRDWFLSIESRTTKSSRGKEEGVVRCIGLTAERPSAGVEGLLAAGTFDTMQVRYNLMYQHVSDWHNNTGVIRRAEEHGMGIILMHPISFATPEIRRMGSWMASS
jgi:predicted aldo/keto reductase-like oxidoreductase